MRITELPQATSVAQTDDLAIDVPGGRTYKVPRSILAPAPFVVTITTGQWSGSGSDRYITVTATNVTVNAMLYPFFDNASGALLKGPVWCVPAAGSFTIHTSAIPAGTVTISVLLAGILGEAQYQVLADVYSKSQTDALIAQSTATLQGEIQKKASFKKVSWNQSTTTGTEYTSVVDIDPTEYMPSNSFKVVFVSATYASGRPNGLRIGIALSTAGDVNFYKIIESENYTDLSNGIFICINSDVKRLVVQEKLASNSGVLIGTVEILAL